MSLSRVAPMLAVVAISIVACSSSSNDFGDDGSGASSDSGNSTTSGSGPSTGAGTPITCTDEMTHTGDGTFYDADGTGNCSFDKSSDNMVGAMNHTDYAASAVCGECVAIDGPSGSVNIQIVDQCPECKPGDIDLSPQAFSKLADQSLGRVKISWKVVSCGFPGPIQYYFKDGSNPYWTAVQIRNSQNAILKVEAMKNGSYEELTRQDYNYFLDSSGLGNGPFSFRVTDIYGHVLEDSGIALEVQKSIAGGAQFPACGQ